MTRDEVLRRLREMVDSPSSDPEMDHFEADKLLLNLIGDAEIAEAFNEIEKWYA